MVEMFTANIINNKLNCLLNADVLYHTVLTQNAFPIAVMFGLLWLYAEINKQTNKLQNYKKIIRVTM